MIDATNGNDGLRAVVAIGASAGGVEALSRLAGGLSAEVQCAYLVVLHVPARAPSVLARILDRRGPLPALTAENGTPLLPGHIYVSIPDRHLLVDDHRIVLSQGPTENGHRPAINALFRSVAVAFGSRAVGVLLSGVLDDGVHGLAAIRSRGGVTIGQSPDDALFPAMPMNARDAGVLDRQAAAGNVGAVLHELLHRDIKEPDMETGAALELENRIAMASRFSTNFDTQQLGAPAGYTCPDCNGSLISVTDGQFRCQVGHAWTVDALLAARDDEVDTALWIALRSLEEKARLARRMATRLGPGRRHQHYINLADESERALAVLGERLAAPDPGGGAAGG